MVIAGALQGCPPVCKQGRFTRSAGRAAHRDEFLEPALVTEHAGVNAGTGTYFGAYGASRGRMNSTNAGRSLMPVRSSWRPPGISTV